ncbi:protein UPSTREAM OF FLC [Salix suchowensis]|nr:protein UPSTREAM OF FLC [Salix suchowensis]
MAAAVSSRGGRNSEVVQIPRKWKEDREITPERTREVWTESQKQSRKAPVVYYLSRNGQLEHPHFMEVPLSSNDGLYLSDVINRLDLLRGKGMASLYSWSSKRSFKNGFVWQDLAGNDFIHPAHGDEYVLKGSELLDHCDQQLFPEPKPRETSQSSTSQASEFPVVTRRRNQSLSSINLNEYKVYKTESSESARKPAADASTQTDDSRRRRRHVKPEFKKLQEEKKKCQEPEVNKDEIMEISPPRSDSSPETLESLMKADGRLVLGGNNEGSGLDLNQTVKNCGKTKASTVLRQFISCSSSISFRDCGAMAGKEPGLPFISEPCKGRLPCGGGGNREGTSREIYNFSRVKLEEKEYFSGSLIETKKEEVPASNLKRSSSCSAARSSRLRVAEKEIEGWRTKCIPRKSKAMVARKESIVNVVVDNNNTENDDGSNQAGSKILEVQDEGR